MKICSLLPSSTEIIYALGLQDQLVAVTHECDYPPQAASKPQITASIINHAEMNSREIDHHVSANIGRHGSIYHLKEDLLETLKPDLIITQELCDVCAVSYRDVQRAARVLDGQTKIVSLEPNTLEEVFDTILLVGELTGTEETALQKVRELKARLDRVRLLVENARRPRVYCMEWLDPPFSGGHWVPEMVQIAGGEEVLGKPGAKSERITSEQVIASTPEVVVLMPCGFSLERTVEEFGHAAPAIGDAHVYAVDGSSYFNRSGPRLVDGVEILAEILHPDRCKGIAPERSFQRIR